MTKTEATALASDFAEQKGYDIHQYTLKAKKTKREWQIYFQRSSETEKPNPGDFFTVCIDDTARSVQRIFYGK